MSELVSDPLNSVHRNKAPEPLPHVICGWPEDLEDGDIAHLGHSWLITEVETGAGSFDRYACTRCPRKFMKHVHRHRPNKYVYRDPEEVHDYIGNLLWLLHGSYDPRPCVMFNWEWDKEEEE